MSTVSPRADSAPPPPCCPVCNQPAISKREVYKSGFATANYLCPNEHIWLTKWLLEVPV